VASKALHTIYPATSSHERLLPIQFHIKQHQHQAMSGFCQFNFISSHRLLSIHIDMTQYSIISEQYNKIIDVAIIITATVVTLFL